MLVAVLSRTPTLCGSTTPEAEDQKVEAEVSKAEDAGLPPALLDAKEVENGNCAPPEVLEKATVARLTPNPSVVRDCVVTTLQ